MLTGFHRIHGDNITLHRNRNIAEFTGSRSEMPERKLPQKNNVIFSNSSLSQADVFSFKIINTNEVIRYLKYYKGSFIASHSVNG